MSILWHYSKNTTKHIIFNECRQLEEHREELKISNIITESLSSDTNNDRNTI